MQMWMPESIGYLVGRGRMAEGRRLLWRIARIDANANVLHTAPLRQVDGKHATLFTAELLYRHPVRWGEHR